MKIQILLATVLVSALVLGPVRSEQDPVSVPTEKNYQGEVVPKLEPHGEALCASGCALSRHPTPELSQEKFDQLLKAYSQEEMSEESQALEELLFYGTQTKSFLSASDKQNLDTERLTFLENELQKERVVAEFRIIDEEDSVRVSLPPTTVNLDRRYVFEPLHTENFQPPEASGTIKRVGLNHVWQRI